ncbi:MAG TPA: phosphate-binding protein [Cyanobacteria bacterium UBA8803]|nr:phosphate-binding protein [Cyanobacteria bacterium UBA9273]HBL61260.1 phosphate-binding protein [Cyanobacteria bacterium UBA8803]
MLSDKTRLVFIASLTTLALGVASCGGNQSTTPAGDAGGGSPAAEGGSPAAAGSGLAGEVKVDGSSTVFPISEAMAEEFQKANSGVRVTVGSSGTGGGFKKFCNGETDISNASRPIKPEEVELCEKGKVEYIELPISYDGLSVVVNPENKFAECLKVDELKKMWEPAAQGKIKTWNQIRPDFPNQPLGLYGAGTDSGTYDFFTKAITGEEGKSRGDYTASEDDNTLVQGVSSDKNGLGFFGYAYYENNKDKLKLVAIDGGKGCIQPSPETINDGTYQPLSRPEFIYVRKEAASRPEVKAFVEYQLDPANSKLISEVGYVPLPAELMTEVQKRFQEGKVGSIFEGKGSQVGVTLKDLLTKEK